MFGTRQQAAQLDVERPGCSLIVRAENRQLIDRCARGDRGRRARRDRSAVVQDLRVDFSRAVESAAGQDVEFAWQRRADDGADVDGAASLDDDATVGRGRTCYWSYRCRSSYRRLPCR